MLAQDLLDNYPRKIHFSPENGKVLLKKLDRMRDDDIVQRQEQEYLRSLGSDPGAGAIEIFAKPK